jgi:redox-sensitive bicupin YhaK (pirin superfamily)
MQVIRRSSERGHADHGWLNSYHSFSFAGYFDPQHVSFGPLRVINEDRVAPGQGFGTHSHQDMEIISYVLQGQLAHKDSMGNGSVIRPGDVQRMSAGTGVQHSEFNPSADEPVHFLQIWIVPGQKGIKPGYEEKRFSEAEKRGKLRLIASTGGVEGSVKVHQDVQVFAGLFDAGEQASLAVSPGRQVYVHLARGHLWVNGEQLHAGDALKLSDTRTVELSRGESAEVLVFDLSADTA